MLNMGQGGDCWCCIRISFQVVQGFFHQPSEQIVVPRHSYVTKSHAQDYTKQWLRTMSVDVACALWAMTMYHVAEVWAFNLHLGDVQGNEWNMHDLT